MRGNYLGFSQDGIVQLHKGAAKMTNCSFFSRESPRMPEGDSSDSEDLSLIPGFGFLPQTMVSRAERIFQARYFQINLRHIGVQCATSILNFCQLLKCGWHPHRNLRRNIQRKAERRSNITKGVYLWLLAQIN